MSISRRTVLKGLGAAIALPLLEGMVPAGVLAAETAKKSFPKRMIFIYVPNGVNMAEWTPKETGSDFKLSSILEPLEPFKKHINVLDGLTCNKARPNGDGPGDHARANASFLTGPGTQDGGSGHQGRHLGRSVRRGQGRQPDKVCVAGDRL